MSEAPERLEAGASAGGGAYSVTLPSFEGPLDLLLHLCQKHELDILDIPIGFITEKYLEYLAVMQLMQLDIASEYLVMAATLAHIKSKMLLPAPPPGQDDESLEMEEDPRESLIRRLLEYQKYKEAGAAIASGDVTGRDAFLRGSSIEQAAEVGLPPLAPVSLYALVEAFQKVLDRAKMKISHEVVAEHISLTDRIQQLAEIVSTRRRVPFDELFEENFSRFDLVITFLALLEMTRLKMTRLMQPEPLGNIWVEIAVSPDSPETTPESP